jgi:hypothetical protein
MDRILQVPTHYASKRPGQRGTAPATRGAAMARRQRAALAICTRVDWLGCKSAGFDEGKTFVMPKRKRVLRPGEVIYAQWCCSTPDPLQRVRVSNCPSNCFGWRTVHSRIGAGWMRWQDERSRCRARACRRIQTRMCLASICLASRSPQPAAHRSSVEGKARRVPLRTTHRPHKMRHL